MKKCIRILLVTSFILLSNNLLALPPSATPELTVSVISETIIFAEINKLCVAGSITKYVTPGAGISNTYFCSIPLQSLTLPNGLTPVGNFAASDLNNDGLLNVVFRFAGANESASTVLNAVCNSSYIYTKIDSTCITRVPNKDLYNCSNVENLSIDGGIIDIEASKLSSSNIVCNQKKLSQTSIRGRIYNTPVSLNLRNALQCAQGLTVNAEDEANMPSLPKEIIASIFNGGVSTWDKLQAKKADGTYAPLSIAVKDKIANGLCPSFNVPSDNRIRICRADNDSFRTNLFRIKLLNSICTSEAQDILTDNTPASSTDGQNFKGSDVRNVGNNPSVAAVIANSAVEFCLKSFSDHNVDSLSDTNVYPDQERWAIGNGSPIRSPDKLNYPGPVAAWGDYIRHIKIDNYAPTVKNVLDQHYFYWAESQWVWITPDNPSLDQLNKIDFQKILMSKFNSYLKMTIPYLWGYSGDFKVNTFPGNIPSLPFNPANPVATSSHVIGGISSSCRTPIIRVNTAF